jgi:hypothetical protein
MASTLVQFVFTDRAGLPTLNWGLKGLSMRKQRENNHVSRTMVRLQWWVEETKPTPKNGSAERLHRGVEGPTRRRRRASEGVANARTGRKSGLNEHLAASVSITTDYVAEFVGAPQGYSSC